MTDDEESELVWDALTEPTHVPFIERMHELKGLVHYTSFAALEGMICNEEIWFSQVMAMNDFDEIIKGKRLLEEMSMEGQPLEGVISKILKIDQELGQRFNEAYRANKNEDLFNTFVSCWSACELEQEIHDNLTMWRGSAFDGNGAAIVIDPIALGLDKLYASQIVAYPVFYETDEQFAERANKTLRHFLKNFAELDRNLINRHSVYAADAFAEICFHLAITHKHPGFHMEKEWRLFGGVIETRSAHELSM